MIDTMSKTPVRKKAYDCASCFNRHHPKWAWFSLFSVGFADVYVRLCSMGVWTDWRILRPALRGHPPYRRHGAVLVVNDSA